MDAGTTADTGNGCANAPAEAPTHPPCQLGTEMGQLEGADVAVRPTPSLQVTVNRAAARA